jgi:hypothetical protein
MCGKTAVSVARCETIAPTYRSNNGIFVVAEET